MKNPAIIFPEANRAELFDAGRSTPTGDQAEVCLCYSTVSPGTERANLCGDENVSADGGPTKAFPRRLGYSSSGIVTAVGPDVRSVRVGDRVAAYWTTHTKYNIVNESRLVKIPDGVGMREAAASFIATFPLAAIRKVRLEIGEPVLVMGLGLLGQYAVRLAVAAGGAPVIGADPVASRRADALRGGADYALDPLEPGFAERVKEITGGGAHCAIEVTGVGAGLDETLDCMARFGRVALLGCTRDKNFTIDYYRKVHGPGITLIGAHTNARPMTESSEFAFTHNDDLSALLKLQKLGRMDVSSMLGPLYSPADCPEVYDRLIRERDFPMLLQFDWGRVKD